MRPMLDSFQGSRQPAGLSGSMCPVHRGGQDCMKRKYIILLILTVVIIVLDQWTKHLVLQRFRLGESIPVISGFFNLTYIRNTGAAFGLLANADPSFRVPFFLIVPVIALIAIGYIFRKIPCLLYTSPSPRDRG